MRIGVVIDIVFGIDVVREKDSDSANHFEYSTAYTTEKRFESQQINGKEEEILGHYILE